MKKIALPVFLTIFIMFTFLEPSTATASVLRASEQITSYNTDVFATGSGELAIQASITGTGIMNSIGIKEIKIYKQSGKNWVLHDTLSKNNPNMYETNTFKYANTISYSGTAGTYYKVVVTVFAENANGSDSRTETHYITAK